MGILKNPILIALARALERFLYARARHIVVNSPAYREHLVQKGVNADKISLIANGVDCRMFDPAAGGERIRQEFNLKGRFVVTYAGALGLANDIPTVLRAAGRLRQHSDIVWLLAGDGKERARLQQLAVEMKLEHVLFAGARPKSEMPEFLAASDACLATLQDIPMFRTTYPNKIFDYMAAGRPTVLAIGGVIASVLEKADGGICVRPGDDRAIAEAVLQLKSDPGRAQAMGRSARAHVVEHFDRAEQAKAFVALLERFGGVSKPRASRSIPEHGTVR